MALLTEAEREKLKERGCYVKEKCDKCGEPILDPVSYTVKTEGGKKEQWCSKCKGKQNIIGASLQQEKKDMATKKAEPKGGKKRELVGGLFRPGTAIAELYELLQDEKKHPLKKTFANIKAAHKVDPLYRVTVMRQYGKRSKTDKGHFVVMMDKGEDTIQLKFGTSVIDKPKKSKAAPAKSTPKAKAPAKEEKSSSNNSAKGAAAVAKLVRRTLKSGDSWTLNKLIEALKKEHGIDSASVQKVVKDEIKAGGITKEGSELSLA